MRTPQSPVRAPAPDTDSDPAHTSQTKPSPVPLGKAYLTLSAPFFLLTYCLSFTRR
ncbi:hypothetical protein OG21DRAFT_1506934, partial [Imleria badia]